jgi:hypothetical protein
MGEIMVIMPIHFQQMLMEMFLYLEEQGQLTFQHKIQEEVLIIRELVEVALIMVMLLS